MSNRPIYKEVCRRCDGLRVRYIWRGDDEHEQACGCDGFQYFLGPETTQMELLTEERTCMTAN